MNWRRMKSFQNHSVLVSRERQCENKFPWKYDRHTFFLVFLPLYPVSYHWFALKLTGPSPYLNIVLKYKDFCRTCGGYKSLWCDFFPPQFLPNNIIKMAYTVWQMAHLLCFFHFMSFVFLYQGLIRKIKIKLLELFGLLLSVILKPIIKLSKGYLQLKYLHLSSDNKLKLSDIHFMVFTLFKKIFSS